MERIARIQEMLVSNPADSFLRHALALEYIKQGSDAEARSLFEAVLLDAPGYVGSYYHLGKLLERAGEAEEAVRCYERGMEQARLKGEQHALNELRAAWEELTL